MHEENSPTFNICVYLAKDSRMFLIQLPFIMKSLEEFMNYEFILWWKIKWDVLFQSKHLGTSPKRQTYSLPGMYYSLGKMKVHPYLFFMDPFSPQSLLWQPCCSGERLWLLGLAMHWSSVSCPCVDCRLFIWLPSSVLNHVLAWGEERLEGLGCSCGVNRRELNK